MATSTSPRYSRLAGDHAAQTTDQEDYFDAANNTTRRSNAHTYHGTPGAESIPLTAVPPYQAQSRNPTGNTLSTLGSASKPHRFSIANFSTPNIASPWEHDAPLDKLPTHHDSVRDYNYRTQRLRLFNNSVYKLIITLILCGATAGALVGYSRRDTVNTSQRHVFNAVVTGLSLAIGVNLASSLRRYAQMLRWRLLASGYRSLREFELILSCESQEKALRLLWIARKRRFPFVSLTQFICFLWILVNVAAQVLVAMLGLTYSLEQSTTNYQPVPGNVSIADLSQWVDLYNSTGQDYRVYNNGPPDQQVFTQTLYSDDSQDYVMYRFIDQNPDNSLIQIPSDRTINSTSVCFAYPVIDGGYGNQTNITYNENGTNQTLEMGDKVSPGATTYISETSLTCGPRCTRVMAFQAADGLNVDKPMFFDCNSTVSHVNFDNSAPSGNDSMFDMPDEQAHIAAGAIGWTGFFYVNDTREVQLYEQGSIWAPPGDMANTDVAYLISEFTMGAVGALDDHGHRRNVSGEEPFYALHVTVEWKWAASLLGVIPLIHFLAMIAVIAWANKAIIKDDSHLATARLLRPVVEKLGPHGCMLTGAEIARQFHLRVMYGYREPAPRSDVRHLDILDEGEKIEYQRAFPRGNYDGEAGVAPKDTLRRRRRSTSF